MADVRAARGLTKRDLDTEAGLLGNLKKLGWIFAPREGLHRL